MLLEHWSGQPNGSSLVRIDASEMNEVKMCLSEIDVV